MRSPVIAFVFIALIASAHCQSTIFQCLNEASVLANQIGDYVKMKNWFDTQALMQMMGKVNSVVTICGPLVKAKDAKKLGINLNLACIGKLASAIEQIKKAKGSFSGGLNPMIIISELANIGMSVETIRKVCNI